MMCIDTYTELNLLSGCDLTGGVTRAWGVSLLSRIGEVYSSPSSSSSWLLAWLRNSFRRLDDLLADDAIPPVVVAIAALLIAVTPGLVTWAVLDYRLKRELAASHRLTTTTLDVEPVTYRGRRRLTRGAMKTWRESANRNANKGGSGVVALRMKRFGAKEIEADRGDFVGGEKRAERTNSSNEISRGNKPVYDQCTTGERDSYGGNASEKLTKLAGYVITTRPEVANNGVPVLSSRYVKLDDKLSTTTKLTPRGDLQTTTNNDVNKLTISSRDKSKQVKPIDITSINRDVMSLYSNSEYLKPFKNTASKGSIMDTLEIRSQSFAREHKTSSIQSVGDIVENNTNTAYRYKEEKERSILKKDKQYNGYTFHMKNKCMPSVTIPNVYVEKDNNNNQCNNNNNSNTTDFNSEIVTDNLMRMYKDIDTRNIRSTNKDGEYSKTSNEIPEYPRNKRTNTKISFVDETIMDCLQSFSLNYALRKLRLR